MRSAWLVSVCVLAGCSGPPAPVCGEGVDPVIVTGLAGRLDGDAPVVEVQLLVPESCDVLDETWMIWDEATDSVTLGDEPTSGNLVGAGVETDPSVIFFRDLNLGVRLDYPGEAVSDELTLTWFTASTDLVAVHCVRSGEALECASAP